MEWLSPDIITNKNRFFFFLFFFFIFSFIMFSSLSLNLAIKYFHHRFIYYQENYRFKRLYVWNLWHIWAGTQHFPYKIPCAPSKVSDSNKYPKHTFLENFNVLAYFLLYLSPLEQEFCASLIITTNLFIVHISPECRYSTKRVDYTFLKKFSLIKVV